MILFDSYLKHYGFSKKEYVEGDKNNFTCELSSDHTFQGRFVNSFGDFTTINGRWGHVLNVLFWFKGNAKGYKQYPNGLLYVGIAFRKGKVLYMFLPGAGLRNLLYVRTRIEKLEGDK
tara:strand:+ start:240 stop:593 length:354 start_codon:yes stop_codon:yes gene_type:complete